MLFSFKYFRSSLSIIIRFARHGSSRLFLSTLVYLIVSGFGTVHPNQNGEILGRSNKKGWKNDAPAGMVLVPSGTFLMGGGVNQGVIERTNIIQRKTITQFYMDETAITNAQYREFISIVRSNPELYGLDETYIDEKLMPDKNVWKKDFGSRFMGDELTENYYDNPIFDNYPVVGITWEAAKEYAKVRSIYKNEYLKKKGLPLSPSFRLPTAAEWEYAAKGGQEHAQYPWGGPFVRDEQGKLLANFQATKGNFAECGYTYTSPVKAFPPNSYGLYDMAGNIAEWCEDDYTPLLAQKSCSINPVYREDGVAKVIKGGSWKDISYFLQTGVFDCEHKDKSRSFIGFRCVMPVM
ncbi:SUMF1/EgtB/PvdO family nonheme iron enzyme [Cardinium endosymbiont of Culicoides punctatus]|uniref:type IX secretion system lipoprotein PorK/GldK n=1 Tax=Cardinium endosymbiont of Culicoides punctatus TaxID=2304601 RepID=UPI00105846EA|nr:SUMF1/EgtB/PvdO family nonheme iron enzyme [Cardinium endosymbiont of Culicoides punctatus]TDG95748.1 Serine/threonine-protein kinase pkn1 [Cardinium endosymbiont of Culicoides punctatus]